MSQTMHSRSTCGISEHRSLDSSSGSIGSTRLGKVDEVARRAPRRRAPFPGARSGPRRRSRRSGGSRRRFCSANRVVEVARILAVDRDQRQARAGPRGRRRPRAVTAGRRRAPRARPRRGNSCDRPCEAIARSIAVSAPPPSRQHPQHAPDRIAACGSAARRSRPPRGRRGAPRRRPRAARPRAG